MWLEDMSLVWLLLWSYRGPGADRAALWWSPADREMQCSTQHGCRQTVTNDIAHFSFVCNNLHHSARAKFNNILCGPILSSPYLSYSMYLLLFVFLFYFMYILYILLRVYSLFCIALSFSVALSCSIRCWKLKFP